MSKLKQRQAFGTIEFVEYFGWRVTFNDQTSADLAGRLTEETELVTADCSLLVVRVSLSARMRAKVAKSAAVLPDDAVDLFLDALNSCIPAGSAAYLVSDQGPIDLTAEQREFLLDSKMDGEGVNSPFMVHLEE